MRHKPMLLYLANAFMLGMLGCQNRPDLKPPPAPEVLASPTDTRYARDPRYPASELANDPVKQKVQDIMNGKGGARPASMNMGGGGMPQN